MGLRWRVEYLITSQGRRHTESFRDLIPCVILSSVTPRDVCNAYQHSPAAAVVLNHSKAPVMRQFCDVLEEMPNVLEGLVHSRTQASLNINGKPQKQSPAPRAAFPQVPPSSLRSGRFQRWWPRPQHSTVACVYKGILTAKAAFVDNSKQTREQFSFSTKFEARTRGSENEPWFPSYVVKNIYYFTDLHYIFLQQMGHHVLRVLINQRSNTKVAVISTSVIRHVGCYIQRDKLVILQSLKGNQNKFDHKVDLQVSILSTMTTKINPLLVVHEVVYLHNAYRKIKVMGIVLRDSSSREELVKEKSTFSDRKSTPQYTCMIVEEDTKDRSVWKSKHGFETQITEAKLPGNRNSYSAEYPSTSQPPSATSTEKPVFNDSGGNPGEVKSGGKANTMWMCSQPAAPLGGETCPAVLRGPAQPRPAADNGGESHRGQREQGASHRFPCLVPASSFAILYLPLFPLYRLTWDQGLTLEKKTRVKCLSSLLREEGNGERVQQGTFTIESGWHILASADFCSLSQMIVALDSAECPKVAESWRCQQIAMPSDKQRKETLFSFQRKQPKDNSEMPNEKYRYFADAHASNLYQNKCATCDPIDNKARQQDFSQKDTATDHQGETCAENKIILMQQKSKKEEKDRH
ncbi:hypothetical protein DV515_00000053 [Chloebia gouldiae]|uniref:Uncharacterized protein n=1 Tax=Chloebia gouldiae TaxID=44316 RepID=A0A3L8T254_CHLGU|nr:hypothetical protein DV515_00000053 [Chloebia gouldiae]